MALPQTITAATPLDADPASQGASQIRALKQFLEDMFGIPDATSLSAAIMGINSDGTMSTPATAKLGSITAQKALLNGTATWNNAAVLFTAILANITNTASAAGSNLIDLQIGGTSAFTADKTGKLTAGTVPLARMGTVAASGTFNTVLNNNPVGFQFASSATGHKFYIISAYDTSGTYGISYVQGAGLGGVECWITRNFPAIGQDTIYFKNMTSPLVSVNISYKVYSLTET